MERIVAICSTVVTRRTVCFISAATRYGLFLLGIVAQTFSVLPSGYSCKVTRSRDIYNGTLCVARTISTMLLLLQSVVVS